mmetsp:Transcript_29492/g.53498  ORF Transcript_29492/g.53498 Transcript_29492/m.53498 type:complete len:206 (+) Transcript_29492:347-964(+)
MTRPTTRRTCAFPPSVWSGSAFVPRTRAPWRVPGDATPDTETMSSTWIPTSRLTSRPSSRTRSTPASTRRSTVTASATGRTPTMASTRRSASTTATWPRAWSTASTTTPTTTTKRKRRRRWNSARWPSAASSRWRTTKTARSVGSRRTRRRSRTTLALTAPTPDPAFTWASSPRRPAPSSPMMTAAVPPTILSWRARAFLTPIPP